MILWNLLYFYKYTMSIENLEVMEIPSPDIPTEKVPTPPEAESSPNGNLYSQLSDDSIKPAVEERTDGWYESHKNITKAYWFKAIPEIILPSDWRCRYCYKYKLKNDSNTTRLIVCDIVWDEKNGTATIYQIDDENNNTGNNTGNRWTKITKTLKEWEITNTKNEELSRENLPDDVFTIQLDQLTLFP